MQKAQINADKLYKALPDLIPEKVNLNGSSRESLVAGYVKILEALRAVSAAMSEAAPHGRDYQTHTNPEASFEARRAWAQRQMLISEMLTDFGHSAEMVCQQQ